MSSGPHFPHQEAQEGRSEAQDDLRAEVALCYPTQPPTSQSSRALRESMTSTDGTDELSAQKTKPTECWHHFMCLTQIRDDLGRPASFPWRLIKFMEILNFRKF